MNDTWTWNGTTWAQLSPSTSPSGRTQSTMAYDQATSELLLFGGDGASGALNDTWAWNGAWSKLSPATSPAVRYLSTMAYDPITSQMVLFGGYNLLSDTWLIGAPIITSVSPPSGAPAGGASVTITGTGFSGVTGVSFGSTPVTGTPIVNSTTSMTVTVPAGVLGTVDVIVTTGNGPSTANPLDQFTYEAVPTVTALNPVTARLAGGNVVTITGTGLTNATTVMFGSSLAANYTYVSPTQITATSPTEAAGTVDVTVTTPVGTSATTAADHFTFEAPPTVGAVSPSVGSTLGGTTVAITGTGYIGTENVSFGTAVVNCTLTPSPCTVNSPTSLTVTSPAEAAGLVDITVTTAVGTSATGPADQFNVLAPPTVSAITPQAGPVAGGTAVTITGTGFAASGLGATTAVDFGTVVVNCTLAPSPCTVNSPTSLTVTSPAGSAGWVDVTATNVGGTSAISTTDQFTYVAGPTVSAITPQAGPVVGGTAVTITGTGFAASGLGATTAVDFGTVVVNCTLAPSPCTVNSPTSLTVTSPAGSAGWVDVTVTKVGGTSATSGADKFTYMAQPTVSAITPQAGPVAGGTAVTITGTGFAASGLGATTAVDFGTAVVNCTLAPSPCTVNSPTSLTVTSPAGSAGWVDVTVTNVGGTSAISTTDQFTYVAGPTVSAITPQAGPVAGGTAVTISGTGFAASGLGATTAVDFGTVVVNCTLAPSPCTVNSPTSLTVTSPAGSAGWVDVTATNVGGTSAISTTDQFTYVAGPTVSAITPQAGPVVGGTAVTITGTGFAASGLGATTAVDFGTVVVNCTLAPSPCTVNSPTSLTVTSPAGSAGWVDVTVTNVGGTSAISTTDQFTYVAGPTVSAITPQAGPVLGGTAVTITGTGFAASGLGATTAVDFGTVVVNCTLAPSPCTVNSPTSLTVTSPAGSAGSVDVTVTNVGGTSAISTTDQFTYVAPPTVSAITPQAGPVAGGTAVTITGTGFAASGLGATTAVDFGTVVVNCTLAPSPCTVNSPTSLTVTSPAGSAGSVDVTVTNVGDTSATSGADKFTYVAAPTVSAITPQAGPVAGGTAVTITGTGFTGASTVDFGPTLVASTFNSPTSITLASPPGAAGVVAISVSTPLGGTSVATSADLFTYGTVTVTSPGAQSNLAGAAITRLVVTAVDSSSIATLTYTAPLLPPGLTINPGTGAISGAPTTNGVFYVTITVTDNLGLSGTATFTWTIINTVLVATPANQSNVSGTAIAALANSASDSSSTATIIWSATGLPAGLSVNPANGTITGMPTTAGTSNVTVTATDNADFAGSASFTWTITNTIAVTNPGPQSDPSGSAITALAILATDTSAATISWSATGLPAGLSINAASGTITGNPSTGGSSSVTVTATDTSEATGSATFAWTITNSVSVANPGPSRPCRARPSPPLALRPPAPRPAPASPGAPPACPPG